MKQSLVYNTGDLITYIDWGEREKKGIENIGETEEMAIEVKCWIKCGEEGSRASCTGLHHLSPVIILDLALASLLSILPFNPCFPSSHGNLPEMKSHHVNTPDLFNPKPF